MLYENPMEDKATKTRTPQQDIVDRAGVCLRTYRDIEHCVTDRGFSTKTLKAVAKVLDISHGTLADMIDPNP